MRSSDLFGLIVLLLFWEVFMINILSYRFFQEGQEGMKEEYNVRKEKQKIILPNFY